MAREFADGIFKILGSILIMLGFYGLIAIPDPDAGPFFLMFIILGAMMTKIGAIRTKLGLVKTNPKQINPNHQHEHQKIVVRCPNCQNLNDEMNSFCGICGHQLRTKSALNNV